jgi:hypothetical protein
MYRLAVGLRSQAADASITVLVLPVRLPKPVRKTRIRARVATAPAARIVQATHDAFASHPVSRAYP